MIARDSLLRTSDFTLRGPYLLAKLGRNMFERRKEDALEGR